MSSHSITINNEKIWSFFKERHPSLHVEDCILLFIDFIEKFTENMNTTLQSSMFMNLFENVKQLQTQVDGVSRLQSEQNAGFAVKLADFKRDYIEDVKLILSSNVSDKIAPLIREQNLNKWAGLFETYKKRLWMTRTSIFPVPRFLHRVSKTLLARWTRSCLHRFKCLKPKPKVELIPAFER